MKKHLLLIPLFLLLFRVFAQDIPGMNHEVLDNGLEVFVLENHGVPLATVQITFRCGALTQDPETAGLFHLYEHMLFKGNRTYPTQSEFMAAMKGLGVGNWNGGTSTEYVTYYFTIPSDRIREGIRFWSEAVRYPLLNPEELASEKEVVINEIKGYHNDPSDNFSNAVAQNLFYKYPWRRDVSGPVDNVADSTIEQLKTMQDTFYTPDNCALFVAGDVDPSEIRDFTQELFGDWERSPEPFEITEPHPLMTGDSQIVFQEPAMYPGFAQIEIYLRGPDVLADPAATYAADVLLTLLDSPESRFRKAVFEKVPSLYAEEYIWKSYYTQKDGGQIFIGTYAVINGETDPYGVAELFRQAVFDEIEVIISDPDYFAEEDYTILKNILEDQRLISMEVPSSFISEYSFWWASASTDYFKGYIKNMKMVEHKEIASYLSKYVTDKPSLLTIRMNPDLYDQYPVVEGFEEIVRDSSYWWQSR